MLFGKKTFCERKDQATERIGFLIEEEQNQLSGALSITMMTSMDLIMTYERIQAER